jgi:hypothetical protein
MSDVKLPPFRHGLYQHKKGGLYHALGLAIEEATLKPVVVYVHVDDSASGVMWTRPLESWDEIVEWPDGSKKQRFVWVSSTESDDVN